MSLLYVLGTGFTVPGGLPVMNKVLDEVKPKQESCDGNNEKGVFASTINEWTKFDKEKNMEEFFTYLVKEGKKREERDFLYSFCRTLHLCWTEKRDTQLSVMREFMTVQAFYFLFLEKVFKENASIISFNYDLIIDNLLILMGKRPDYGFEPDDNEIRLIHPDFYGRLQKSNLFLKLHGSMNWYKCSTCRKSFIKLDPADTWSTGITGDDNTGGATCPQCNKGMDFLMIPPRIGKKPQSNEPRFLKNIWDLGFAKIASAEKIIFIGYNFPPSDKNLMRYFKEALEFRRLQNKNITVVTLNPDVDFEERYKCV